MSNPTALQVAIRRPWIRRLLGSVLALLLLWALAWLVVPPLLKHQLIKAASTQIGRGLQIGEIDFKPWSLELTVRDLAVASQDGASTQLAIKRLYANIELESLLRLAPVVDTLTVDGPKLRVRRLASGAYDFDDVLERLTAAAAKKKDDSADPPRFALFNLSVRDGSVDLDDQPVARQHQLRALSLDLPFLSNLPARREITVTPQLAFTLNGSQFDSRASTTPFAPSRKTDAVFQVKAMDLAPYLPYIPRSVPVRLQRAVLDANLELKFEQEGDAQVVISGQLALTNVAMADAAGGDLLAFDSLKVVFDEVRPLEQKVKIASVALQGPRVSVTRDPQGHINVARLGASAPETSNASSKATVVKPEPTTGAPAPMPATGWQVALAELSVRDGVVRWQDTSLAPAAALQADALTLDLRDANWPMARPLAFKGSLALGSPGSTDGKAGSAQGAVGRAALRFEGKGTDTQADVQLNLGQASLGLLAPYLAQILVPELQGNLNADLALRWKAPDLHVAVSGLTVEQLALVTPGAGNRARLASVRKLAVSDAQIDLSGRKVSVASVELTQPEAAITRGADRLWMAEQWLRQPTGVASAPSTGRTGPSEAPSNKASAAAVMKTAPAGENGVPWQGRVDAVRLRAGAFRFDDNAVSPAVAVDVSALELELKNLSLDGKQTVPTRLTARVAARKGEAGSMDYRGTVRVYPLQVKGNVQAQQIPLHGFEPYFGEQLNVDIARADAGFKGDVDYADNGQGPVARVRGDLVLEDFRANSVATRGGEAQLAQELLNWKALGLRGVDLALTPGKPVRVAVRETSLSDFFARVIVHENGRINLQDLVRSGDPAQLPVTGSPATGKAQDTARPAAPVAVAGTGIQGDRQMAQTGAVPAAPTAPTALPTPDPMAPDIQIGPISLVHGKVYFSDRFIKPNYSANLTELTGKLSAFSSKVVPGQPSMADLELRGRAEGTASLEILGQLNPLATPLALDIKGRVRDLELPPLSPYSIKYAGHGIERGKLSVDVAYLIKPDGQLTATNQVVLNQLVFGEKVEGAPNSLPVRLAVALLADRNGVIDINLPVSGSLNDPQFRLGPVIFKVIVNLIGKALTAPFTLLASAFGGGGDELSQVAFANGSPVLMPAATGGLDKVAKALTDRPMLKMTVVGTANLAIERDAYQRRRLQELMQAEQRRAAVVRGVASPAKSASPAKPASAPATSASPANLASAPATSASAAPAAAGAAVVTAGTVADTPEAAELLRQVYLRSEIVKPRDLDGKAKVLPTAEMQALLLAHIPVDDEAMRALALQRAVAVRDYLIGQKLSADRLFLGAAKTVEADAKWSPRAELTLGNE